MLDEAVQHSGIDQVEGESREIDAIQRGLQRMNKSLQVVMDRQSRKTVIITSNVLLLAGIAGIALPQFMSTAVALFAGWLMIVAGGIAFSFSRRKRSGGERRRNRAPRLSAVTFAARNHPLPPLVTPPTAPLGPRPTALCAISLAVARS